MMVTNLSSFPSSLTVVHVPGGDVKQHRIDFIVNEDLKRMGCSGRSALSLHLPSDATRTKFRQLFRTSERVLCYSAVVELVKLCQLSLTVFGKLKREYTDGLLCDVTEKGLRDWWAEFGMDFYNEEPNDGTLGPMTIAGLLGMVIGARNRLGLCGAPVPKDAFDIPQLEKSIIYFQRQQRLERTGHLDRDTLGRLHRAVNKPTGADIFAVPRAIKSTVVDLSTRAVRSSNGIIDATAVETVDIEHFVRHISGDACKYLWQGKLRKGNPGTTTVTPPRRSSYEARAGSLSGDEDLPFFTGLPSRGQDPADSSPSAVSFQHQQHQLAYSGPVAINTFPSLESSASREATVSDLRKAVFKSMSGRMKDVASGISAGADYMRGRHQRSSTRELVNEDDASSAASTPSRQLPPEQKLPTAPPSPQIESLSQPISSEYPTTIPNSSVAASLHSPIPPTTTRRNSFSSYSKARNDAYLPSRASFSLAEEAVLAWSLPFEAPTPTAPPPPNPYFERLRAQVRTLETNMTHLYQVLEDKSAAVGTAQRGGVSGIENERERVREAVREAEVLGARMRYEIGVVEGKVLDLEEAVGNLGRFVEEVEAEVGVLEGSDEEKRRRRRGWWAWLWGK